MRKTPPSNPPVLTPPLLGELSAVRLTEGLFYCHVNILANFLKISVDFIVRNSKNSQTIAFKKRRPLSIFYNFVIFIML